MKTKIVRFIDVYVPTEACNFNCPYCYIGQKKDHKGPIRAIGHSPSEVRSALSMRRWGGTMFLNFCAGGETLLGEDLLPIIKELLCEGHYVQIVTNGTITKRFEEISEWPKSLLTRLFVKFSFHYTELKRLGLLDEFFGNIQLVKENGISFSLELTPCDEMIPLISEIKEVSVNHLGALPHVTVARDENSPGWKILSKLNEEDYKKTWDEFESPMFDLKMKLLSEKRTEFCYGGEWTFSLILSSGDLKQCYRGAVIDNIYKEISSPIHFKPIGHKCPEHYCYNGHAWMTWGCIPGTEVPSYADMRDRKTNDGKRWLTDGVREAFSQKLGNNNVIYDEGKKLPRILLMGDSISVGYSPYVKKLLEDTAEVFYMGDVCRDSTNLLRYIAEWASKLKIGSDINVVYFNVGLWDILRIYGDSTLVSETEYASNLKRIVDRIRFVCPNAKLVFATTTYVNEMESSYELLRKNEDVNEYNDIAQKVMAENGVTVHDLNSVSLKIKDCYEDMVHFSDEGYMQLALSVVNILKQEING